MLIRPAKPADAAEIEVLLDAAFGPDRRTRTAAKLRAGATPLPGPSLVARDARGALLGSIQLWPIALLAVSVLPLTLLGPLAVVTPGTGVGRALLAEALAIADAAGLDPILLIGDEPYYGPFGFAAAATAGWEVPGPVERDRLLLRQRISCRLPRVARVVPADSVAAAKGATVAVDA